MNKTVVDNSVTLRFTTCHTFTIAGRKKSYQTRNEPTQTGTEKENPLDENGIESIEREGTCLLLRRRLRRTARSFGPIADSEGYPDGAGQPIYRAGNSMNQQTN